MWRYFQPNPLKISVGDCTVRALCAATGMDWYTAHKALCDLSSDLADMPSADRVFKALLEQFGFSKQRLIDQCPDCFTVSDFAREHPRGIYILGPHEHVVTVINGDWWDAWDSGSTVPSYFFKRR